MSESHRRPKRGWRFHLWGRENRRRKFAQCASAFRVHRTFVSRIPECCEDRILLAGHAPNLQPIDSIHIYQGAPIQTVSLTGIAAGGAESQPIRVTATSDNTSVIPHPSVTYTSAASTGILRFTPNAATGGVATITVTVEDGGPDLNMATPDDNEAFSQEFQVIVTPLRSSLVQNLTVDARANLTYAGSASAPAGVVRPLIVDLPAGTGRWIEMSSVRGLVNAGPGWPTHGADGATFGPNGTTGTNIFAARGISGILASRFLFLSGVFLTDAAPVVSPNRLDYRSLGFQFGSQSPSIQQVFFIGDGRSTGNSPQRFFIPDNATRLSLGFMDAVTFGWPDGLGPGAYADNTGALSASLTINVPNQLPTLNHIPDRWLKVDAPQQTVSLNGISAGLGESQPIRISAVSDNAQLVVQPIVNYNSPDVTGSLTFTSEPGQTGIAKITVAIEDGGPDGDLATTDDNAVLLRRFRIVVGSFGSVDVKEVVIDARMDLSHASRSSTPDPPNRLLPVLVDLPAGRDRWLEFTSVTGQVKAGPDWPLHDADGGMLGPGGTAGSYIYSARGITGIRAPRFLFLAGTFLNDETPDVSPSGYDYRFSGIEFAKQTPIRQQVFFVGDGKNSDGARPPIQIPDDATRLFLGFMDANNFGWPNGLLPDAYHDNTGELTASLSIIVPNAAPTLDDIADVSLTDGETEHTINLHGIAAGAGESQPLRISATSSNASLFANPAVTYLSGEASGSLQLIPQTGISGTAVVSVGVEDGGPDQDLETADDNAFTIRTFNVNVRVPNDPPTLDAISDLSLDEDAAELSVNILGITAGGIESQPLRVTAASDNTVLIPNPSVSFTSPNRSAILAVQPNPDQFGSANIVVTVEDAGPDGDFGTTIDNATFSRTFEVMVNTVNDPPTMAPLPDLELAAGAGATTVVVTGLTAGAGESQPLRLRVHSSNTDLVSGFTFDYTSPNLTGSFRFNPKPGQSGLCEITVTIEDGGFDGDLETSTDNATFSRQFEVLVQPPALGNVDGDVNFDANDSFLIQLIGLAGTDAQIDQSKGGTSFTAAQIRDRVNNLAGAADVDGDGDFDANDAFLIHLVKLSGTNGQIDQSKGASPLTAIQIRTRIDDLGSTGSGSGSRVVARRSTSNSETGDWLLPSLEKDALFPTSTLPKDENVTVELDEEKSTVSSSVIWNNFRAWIDAI